MKRLVLLYGLIGGVLITLLHWSEYRFLVVEHSFEIYGGLIAAVFSGLGIWLGVRLTGARKPVVVKQAVISQVAVSKAVVQEGVVPELLISQVAVPAAVIPAPVVEMPAVLRDDARRDELGITRRELEILELMAEGLSNREIAERLFVSENTVKTHSSRVFDKLGAKRRTQAVQFGKQMGLLR